MGKVHTPKGRSAPGATDVRTEETSSKKPKKTFKQVLKRYWYWFATIPLLIVVSFVWLYFIGVFDTVNAIVVRSTAPQDINLPVNSTYHLVVTTDTGDTPVYSSNHPSIVEVTSDGLLITHNEGAAIVTASFGKKKYQVAVSVSAFAKVWYLTVGDTFSQSDIYNAFPEVSYLLQSVEMSFADFPEYLDVTPGENGVEYVVKDNIPDDESIGGFFYVYGLDEDGRSDQKGVLSLRLVTSPEVKEQKTAEYLKSIGDTAALEIPKDQIDEEVEFDCGSDHEFRPKLKTTGLVRYVAEGIPEGFPYILQQTGSIYLDVMLEDFYVSAVVVDTGEVYRYKCNVLPMSSGITINVGETMLISEYENMVPIDGMTDPSRIKYTSLSAKLREVYDDNGKLIGFYAAEATEKYVCINCSTYEEPEYVRYRFVVTIDTPPTNTGTEGNDD